MKYYSLIVTFFLSSLNLKAQNKLDPSIKKDQIKMGIVFLGAGINYEKRISSISTLNANAELSYAFGHNSTAYYSLTPIFSLEGRCYYNTFRRLRKSKRIDNNSGDFWAISSGIKTYPIINTSYNESPVIFAIPSWGLQRSLAKKFSFTVQLGWAFKYSTVEKNWTNSPNIRTGIYYILK